MDILNQRVNRNGGSRRSVILTGILALSIVLPISTSSLWNTASSQTTDKEKQEQKKAEHDKQEKAKWDAMTDEEKKAYKAAQKAMIAGVENAYAYDAGIPEWARVYPEATQLLGATIKDPESQLISKANFKDHVLDWAGFQDLQGKDAIMTIDVRDV